MHTRVRMICSLATITKLERCVDRLPPHPQLFSGGVVVLASLPSASYHVSLIIIADSPMEEIYVSVQSVV